MKKFNICFLCCFCLIIVGCCCRQKTKAEKEAETKEVAVQKAKAEALQRKCGDANASLSSTCMDLVRRKLLNPSSADFSLIMGRAYERDEETCIERYSSTVDVKNGFGVVIKYRFQCKGYNSKNSKPIVELDYLTAL